MRGGLRGHAFAAVALLGACAAGKFHDEVVIGGTLLCEGMTEADLTRAMGPPDLVAKDRHHFAYEFRETGRTIEPLWREWAWFDEDEIHTYVAYLGDGVVRRVGVITSSPPPPKGDGFDCSLGGLSLGLGVGRPGGCR